MQPCWRLYLWDYRSATQQCTKIHSSSPQTSGESWHQIAWAFLRAGGNGTRLEGQQGGGGGSEAAGEMEERRRNIGKVCRLQLFSYPKRRRNDPLSSISEVY